jgi:hypothetical protein
MRITPKKIRVLLVSLFLLAGGTAYLAGSLSAQQVSPALMQMAQGELQKRGLNEAEVRARLLQEGINVDNIPPAEMPQYQARVTAILDKMVEEKKAQATANVPATQGQAITINVGGTSPATTPVGTTQAVSDSTPLLESQTPAGGRSRSRSTGHSGRSRQKSRSDLRPFPVYRPQPRCLSNHRRRPGP